MAKNKRDQARQLFLAGIAAADPKAGLDRIMPELDLAVKGDMFLVAIGKAAIRMASAAKRHLPRVDHEVIVTNYENADGAGGTVIGAGHPVPDENGALAAKKVLGLLSQAQKDDLVLVFISGGASALLPAPVPGVSLSDKIKFNELLLAGGVDITDMNSVRQHLSLLKGGGLAKAAFPARVEALILSDVVSDDLRIVASGPTCARICSQKQARDILIKHGIWDQCPASVRAALSGSAPVDPDLSHVRNHLIGGNALSVKAMANLAGEQAHVWDHPLEGDVADAARQIVEGAQVGITVLGGETTVELQGNGLGGRNQELGLRVALLAEETGWSGPWVFLSGGTDGRDGPTDAAGALVDQDSVNRMRAAGVDPMVLLADNDAYHALEASGDLLMTGATGTNVADLQVLIFG